MKVLTRIMVFVVFLTSIQGCGIAGANFTAAKGQALYNAGRYEEAEKPLEEAIKTRPEHGTAHYYLALTYLKLGKKQEAITLLENYLRHISQTNSYVGSLDKEAIPKCKELLGQLK